MNKDWSEGYTTAMVFLSDIFESRTQAFYTRNLLRKKDIKFIIRVIDAAIASRDKLARVGPRNMDLILHKSGAVEFVEKKNGKH